MNKVVLLVEDDENDVLFLKRAFVKANIEVDLRVVSDGAEALKYLRGEGPYSDRQKHPHPHVTLLDLNIPYIPGLDVLQHVKADPGLRKSIIVVLTSSPAEADIEKAYAAGANSYLLKPSNLPDRVALVRDLGNYWLARNQGPIRTS